MSPLPPLALLRHPRGLRLLAMLALILLVACQAGGPEVDHFAVAKQLALQIAQNDTKKVDLSDPAYEQVAQELMLVPEGSPQKAEADAWLKEIQTARKSKLFALREEEGGSFPSRDPDQEPRPKTRSSKKSGGNPNPGGFPPPPDKIDLDAIAAGMGGSSSASSQSFTSSASKPRRSSGNASVTLYATSWCGVCKQARAYFISKGISYVEKDIEKDASAKAEVTRKVGANAGVPVIDIGGQVLVGFDKKAVDDMLRQAHL